MKNRLIISASLLILFTTFISQNKISFNKYKVQELIIKNNKIIKKDELLKDLSFLYGQNMIFLNSFEIKKKIKNQNFIESFEIKKIYPNKLIVKIIEKEPIAIFIDEKNKKYFLGKKLELIQFKEISKYNNLPTVYGGNENFKKLYKNLVAINFPINAIKRYNFFETNRWNLIMEDEKVIKLPASEYKKSLKNFMEIRINRNFEKYKIFDYRLKNQLILK